MQNKLSMSPSFFKNLYIREYKLQGIFFYILIWVAFMFCRVADSKNLQILQNPAIINREELPETSELGILLGYARISPEWLKSASPVAIPELGKNISYILKLPGYNYKLTPEAFNAKSKSRWVCTGTLAPMTRGTFSLSVCKGLVSLEISDYARKKILKIQHYKNGIHAIIDVSGVVAIHPELYNSDKAINFKRSIANKMQQKKTLGKIGAENLVVHLGVVWTPEASKGAGGSDAIKAEFDRKVMEFNKILADSRINVRWELVYSREVDYTESPERYSYIEYLTDVVTGNDQIDSVVSDCEIHAVDHITLIQETKFPKAAGYGTFTYSIISRIYFFLNPTVAFHEWGHGMGAAHDRGYFADGGKKDKFNYGYIFLDTAGARWSTIMAKQMVWGERIRLFSNPSLTYNGVPAGLSKGSKDNSGKPNSADNVTYINETGGEIAANWRAPGLRGSAKRKFLRIPPGGIQEYRIILGNTSGQEITNISLGVDSLKNSTVVKASPGAVTDARQAKWANLGNLAAGGPGNTAIGPELILTVKVNDDETWLRPIRCFVTYNNGKKIRFMSNMTRVDSTIAIINPNHLTQTDNYLQPHLNFGGRIFVPEGYAGFFVYSINGEAKWQFQRKKADSYRAETVVLPGSLFGCSKLFYIKYLK